MAKKIVLIVLGIVLMLCGLALAIPGTILTALTGGDGRITSAYESIGSSTPALVSETGHVSAGTDRPTSGFGATAITVSARGSDKPLFLGIGRASDVEAYLADVAYDEVRELDISPFRMTTSRHDGASSAPSPEGETFWLASATGDDPALEWQIEQTGDYRFVMMNADGSAGTSAEVQLGVEVSGLTGIGIGAIVVGAVSLLAGLALLVWGIRTRTPAQPAPATGYPGGPQPPGAQGWGQPGGQPPAPPGSHPGPTAGG